MRWTVTNLALLTLIASTSAPLAAMAQSPSPLLTTDRTLLASLERISKGSALWRTAMESVRKTGRRALVVTPADVAMRRNGKGDDRYALDDGALAEAFPVFSGDSGIPMVVVVVNLRLVQRIHDQKLSVPRDFEADLDRILVHEVYGHAVPYLLAGDLSGRCADPKDGESPSEACSIRRENAVRAELGLGRRDDHGIFSLSLALR